MAVNPAYPEPAGSAPSRRTQNPRYGDETPLETPLDVPETAEEDPGDGTGQETLLDASLTHAELDRIAAERGVDMPSDLNKAEKLDLLNSL